MKINSNGEKYIFIELNKNDMNRLGLRYCDMDYRDEETRKAIFSVLSQARLSLGQNFELSDTLKVEALPRDDGGCLLFFTIGRKRVRYHVEKKGSRIAFLFGNTDSLLDLSLCGESFEDEKIKSSLFLSDGRYYLFVSGRLHRLLVRRLGEFARVIKTDELPPEGERETVLSENALEILCGGAAKG